MTKSNGEEPKMGGRMERFQQGVRKRTLLAKKKVQNITKEDVKSYLFRNAFVLLTVTAVIVGTILGFTLRPYRMSYREVKYFSFPGELLMRMLQMLVLPLIISSLVTGMAALDSKASGKMGMRAVVYYMTTTIIAVVIGIIIVIIIHPGKGTKENMHREGKIVRVTAADAFLDLIRNMFPPNLVEACFKQFKTNYEKRSFKVPIQANETLVGAVINNVSEAMETLTRITEELVPVPGSVNGVNALGLVVFSMCFGFVIGNMKEQGQALREFFDSLNEAIMRLVAVIMWYAPVGILFLIAGKIVEMEDMGVIGGQLAMYTVTVIVGLLIHAVIVLPLLYFLVTRKNPWVFIGGLLQALITALGTSSSSATLPITFKCLEENNGVDKRVTRFVLPVGATINMDGTALYEALAAIFIAQVNNFELNFGQIITIRDRLRTTTNVLGDSLGAGIVEHLSRHELKNRDVEMGNSVIEENEMKKPYQLIAQDNETEKPIDSETKM
ncbi:solute carrier family 1 member 3 [Homo sapiens]|uniref:Isoform 2 of Excitatory amino acid transporter 1 n=1 Tax=Homo sapiens TaxID=9606 RepID=P43003-2|nr:excitatory amino acid transporter 1 isoform 2 [Homo sapiens]XP_047273495.1 excitatory amino acid transporter 1 isoform X2 [Homo sapiens]XP_054209165.1 excitatory amino acid transporter 1 isoform X2 [Homo sapiens]AAY28724.1 glutamate transporter variant EAAT1ex9skip [Homo sapiens]KAI2537250.1 solute carrier family 1 member 3 [Homo sapiens]KAI4021044.1 solute carrier family 1 member 3 [Homo sapiens]|eukprot:NP_001160167.1 excitatory amino acid transporter 1 isoform 2 [Homo sapiens]